VLVHVVVQVQVENYEAVLVLDCVYRSSAVVEEPADVQEVVVDIGGSDFLVSGSGSLYPVSPVIEQVHVLQLHGVEHLVVYGDLDALGELLVVGVLVGCAVLLYG
jgi:hypothetical protein